MCVSLFIPSGVSFGGHSGADGIRLRKGLRVQPENSWRRRGSDNLCHTKRWQDFAAPGNIGFPYHFVLSCYASPGLWNNTLSCKLFLSMSSSVCSPLFQEVIVRDSSSGWDLGPDLDHFSSRTRHVLQYMNPNKINMDLLVDLIDYLGTQTGSICQRFIHVLYIKYEKICFWVFFIFKICPILLLVPLPDKAPQFVDVDGAILVFLPGLAHIQQLFDLLSSDKRFRDKTRWRARTDQ